MCIQYTFGDLHDGVSSLSYSLFLPSSTWYQSVSVAASLHGKDLHLLLSFSSSARCFEEEEVFFKLSYTYSFTRWPGLPMRKRRPSPATQPWWPSDADNELSTSQERGLLALEILPYCRLGSLCCHLTMICTKSNSLTPSI